MQRKIRKKKTKKDVIEIRMLEQFDLTSRLKAKTVACKKNEAQIQRLHHYLKKEKQCQTK